MANANAATKNAPSIEELVGRLREIQLGLKQNVANLHEKIELLDDKPELLFSLAIARKDAETHASDLEAEVKQLREELRAIKELLGLNLKKQNPVDS